MKGRIIERADDGYTFRYYESEGGTLYTHWDCERRLKAANTAVHRWFSRSLKTRSDSGDGEQNKWDLQRLRWIAQDIAQYAEIIQRELDRLEGVDQQADRIKALREVAGRTPEEAAAYLAKADELERAGYEAH